MAHHLINFEQVCDQICAKTTESLVLDAEHRSPVNLIEVLPNGEVRNRPLSENLLETYIAADLKASRASCIMSSDAYREHKEPNGERPRSKSEHDTITLV